MIYKALFIMKRIERRKMKEFIRSVKFKLILCIFGVVSGILICSVAAGGSIIFPRSFLETVSQPFVNVGMAVAESISSLTDSLVNAERYREENETLRQMLAEISGKLTAKEAVDAENERYRNILGIAEAHPDYKWSPPCTVIARNANDICGGFTIDRGSADGIELYDPVVTPAGLVGIISGISGHYSVVKTILSPEVKVGIISSESRSAGVTENDAEYAASGLCFISCLPKEESMKEGEVVLTAGSSLFPGGIMIGRAESVYCDNNGLKVHAVIKPAVDVFRVTDVFVVTGFEGQE